MTVREVQVWVSLAFRPSGLHLESSRDICSRTEMAK